MAISLAVRSLYDVMNEVQAALCEEYVTCVDQMNDGLVLIRTGVLGGQPAIIGRIKRNHIDDNLHVRMAREIVEREVIGCKKKAESNIAVGDVVELLSGSDRMTVVHVDEKQMATVVWKTLMDDRGLRRDQIQCRALRKVRLVENEAPCPGHR